MPACNNRSCSCWCCRCCNNQRLAVFEENAFLFVFFTLVISNSYRISVIPNRRAAEHKGAFSWCQRCRQLIQCFGLFNYLTILWCRQISTLLRKGDANKKKVGKPCRIYSRFSRLLPWVGHYRSKK